MAGQNLTNTHYQKDETKISPKTVAQLRMKWATKLRGSIYATPAVDGNDIYIPDSAGYLYRINAQNGCVVWSFAIASYSGIEGDVARVTPVVTENRLIFGVQSGGTQAVLSAPEKGWLPNYGAWLVAVDKRTGKLVWKTQVDAHPAARINQAAVVYGDRVYVGITSWEEVIASIMPDYPCCSFRGSVIAVNRHSGKLEWRRYMTPEGYSGNAVWGGTPVVDAARGQLYVTTGNNYMLPRSVLDCAAAAYERNPADEAGIKACYAPNNYFDAVVALGLDSGDVKWVHWTIPFDAHTHACTTPINPQNCPSPRGPDYDFAQGPMLFTVENSGESRQLLGAGQKSGVFWALEPHDGAVVWKTIVGPGGMTGGMQWGSATDGKRIYVAISNFDQERWKLEGHGRFADQLAFRGFWSALDAATGAVLWQTPDPNAAAMDQGMLTVANGVVFAGSMAGGENTSNMFALDTETGEILWRFPSIGSVNAGAAVVDGTVYWGSGYELWGGTTSNVLYAFEVGGSSQHPQVDQCSPSGGQKDLHKDLHMESWPWRRGPAGGKQ
jgi:polyvinyl alcohol dehydrogenase (cytochrome)